jgi:hypothetical protein
MHPLCRPVQYLLFKINTKYPASLNLAGATIEPRFCPKAIRIHAKPPPHSRWFLPMKTALEEGRICTE